MGERNKGTMTFSRRDQYWMKRTLALSQKAWGNTYPNPLVGAIVLDVHGHQVGAGYHQKAGAPHAEVLALNQAGEKAAGGTLYVSLEPCCHHGKTPPCVEMIKKCSVSRVVVAATDPNPQVKGKGIDYLRSHGLDVEVGLMKEIAERVNEPFFQWMKHHRPWVTSKLALTKKGEVGSSSERIQISGKECSSITMKLRAQSQVLLTGVRTIQVDNPKLTVRGKYQGRSLIRVIMDTHLQTSVKAQLFDSLSDSPVWIFCDDKNIKTSKAEKLVDRGAQIFGLSVANGLSLNEMMELFIQKEIQSVLLETGPTLWNAMIRAEMIDRAVFFESLLDHPSKMEKSIIWPLEEKGVYEPKCLKTLRNDRVIEYRKRPFETLVDF